MTAIYQTHHLNLQRFMMLILLRECLFVSNELVAPGEIHFQSLEKCAPTQTNVSR